MGIPRFATLAAVAVALFATTAVRADYDYVVAPGAGFPLTSGTGGTLTAGPAASGAGLNSSDVILANPSFNSTATSPEAVVFNFSYDLFITSPSGGVQDPTPFTFRGVLQGTGSASTANFTTYSFAPDAPTSRVIGTNTYTVSTVSFTPPGAQGVPGALLIHIEENGVPEPASIALLGLGGLGALAMFRRRKAAKA